MLLPTLSGRMFAQGVKVNKVNSEWLFLIKEENLIYFAKEDVHESIFFYGELSKENFVSMDE